MQKMKAVVFRGINDLRVEPVPSFCESRRSCGATGRVGEEAA